MDITTYTGYFHDGTLLKIDSHEDNIFFFIESFPISAGGINLNKDILSRSGTLIGKLCFINVKYMKIDDQVH